MAKIKFKDFVRAVRVSFEDVTGDELDISAASVLSERIIEELDIEKGIDWDAVVEDESYEED
jgi:hypothetical protein